MIDKLSLLLLVGAFLGSSSALECYNTCFENCSSPECLKNNGASLCKERTILGVNVTIPGFIIQKCSEESDVCLLREFQGSTLGSGRPDELALMTTPGGCLSEFEIEFTEFKYWDRSSTQLYTCNSDRCNIPAVEGCIDDKKCPLKKVNFTEVFGNVIRGGGEEQLGIAERCILDPFIQIDETSGCLEEGCSVDDLTSASIEFISCSECEDALNCEVTEPTPSPSEIVFSADSPTSQPSLSPTIKPTKMPSQTPTKQPSLSPTTEPTKTPSHSPTKSPTIQPSLSPTQTPTKKPTQKPGHIECYNTCFEDCSAEKCFKDNGKSLCKTRTIIDRDILFPGYIIETCPDENDVCLQREFLASGIDGPALMTVPGGCLSQFKLDLTQIDYWDRSSTQLYTCDSNRCNEPPVARCVNKKKCIVKEAEAREMFQNVVRGGGDEQIGKPERCIENPFSQISTSSSCVNSSFPNCFDSEDDFPDLEAFVSCENCSAAFNCNENEPTPAPTDLKFSAEEADQTLINILAAGLGALAVVAMAFACYTKRNYSDLEKKKDEFNNTPEATAMDFELEVRIPNMTGNSAVSEYSESTTDYASHAAHDPELDDPVKGNFIFTDEEGGDTIAPEMVEMLSI